MKTIPIIDIGPYLNNTDKKSVAKEINNACESIGFFMIKNHGIPLELLKNIFQESTKFFSLPYTTKSETSAPFGLGYMGQGMENVGATLDDDNKIQDLKESLNLTLPPKKEIWPESQPMLNEACEAYYNLVLDLASKLMKLFALALDLPEDYFDEFVNEPFTCLRLLNYPSSSTSQFIRNAEHTDYGTLTILWSPDSRGLQAKSREGEWIDVVAPIDCFIINIGDLMMNWTNDTWISTLHRVINENDECRPRFSMPFFHNPNPNAIIECIDTCGEEKKYKPILAKQHLENKVSKALGTTETMDNL